MRTVRTAWRRLTSMRTALILLFLLAVAAVPGSLLPQRPLNPDTTSAYIRSHGGWGRLLNRLGMFDVFGSIWFAAIYLLLFVSLVGCLLPRIKVHARAVARKPLPAPRNLDKLPEHGTFAVAATPAAYASAARHVLGRRWRVAQRVEPSGAVTLSAEKGYSRETGNLIFHVALLAALLLIAVGRLYSYQGTRILLQGQGFCNAVVNYDSWHPGRFAAEDKVGPAPFCITSLTKFTASYGADSEPRLFRADIAYRPSLDQPVQHTAITVNHPLRIEGDRVYLLGHGYAPSVTIRMPNGEVRHDTEPFVPSNAATLFSEGAFKQPGAANAKQDVGLEGFFAPTPTLAAGGTTGSASPQVRNPVLGIVAYRGDLTGRGTSQSVYSLDTTAMKKLGRADLRIGQSKTFAGGVRVTFDGWRPWASLQVSHDPAQTYLLLAALAMVAGLIGSLGVRRRRVWLRIASAAGRSSAVRDRGAGAGAGDSGVIPAEGEPDKTPTVVQVGGLARSDSGNFTAEFKALLARLGEATSEAGAPTAERITGADGSGVRVGADPIGANSIGANSVGAGGARADSIGAGGAHADSIGAGAGAGKD